MKKLKNFFQNEIKCKAGAKVMAQQSSARCTSARACDYIHRTHEGGPGALCSPSCPLSRCQVDAGKPLNLTSQPVWSAQCMKQG